MVVIFDLIGKKSGCMYYNDAFCRALREVGIDAVVVSNYSSNYAKAWLRNMYAGPLFMKGLKLINNVCVFLYLLVRGNKVVYLSYGTSIDLRFMQIGSFSKNLFVDIHEYVQLDVPSISKIKVKFDKVYKIVSLVIYHSSRTESFLRENGITAHALYVPHFKYEFDKTYETNLVGEDIQESISGDNLNVLFFGHFRESKGIRVLMDAIHSLPASLSERFHFIFAGSDPHGEFKTDLNELIEGKNVSVVCRYIETQELNFLFSKINMVVLPYFEVSQSGVLETAVYFRKQLLLTDIPYFKSFIDSFPSFGYLFAKGNDIELANLFVKICEVGLQSYDDSDIDRFYQKEAFKAFSDSFKRFLDSQSIN